jgi:hypothetical protein
MTSCVKQTAAEGTQPQESWLRSSRWSVIKRHSVRHRASFSACVCYSVPPQLPLPLPLPLDTALGKPGTTTAMCQYHAWCAANARCAAMQCSNAMCQPHAWCAAKTTIKILAREHVCDSGRHVDHVKASEQRTAQQCAVGEAAWCIRRGARQQGSGAEWQYWCT